MSEKAEEQGEQKASKEDKKVGDEGKEKNTSDEPVEEETKEGEEEINKDSKEETVSTYPYNKASVKAVYKHTP